MLSLKDRNGGSQTVEAWVKDTEPHNREALYNALAPYVEANSSGPVSLEKFKKDFSNLSNSDRKEFMKTMQDSINYAYSAMTEQELDFALQAELNRRNDEAVAQGWERAVADAKERGEKAKREVHGIDAALQAELDRRKQGAA